MKHLIFLILVCSTILNQKTSKFLYLDHSGKISKLELKQVLHALNIKANEKELTQLMGQMDSDNSGEIDYNEFKNVMGASFFKKYSKHELMGAFKKFDEDGNGFISSKELSHILSRMGRHLSRTEVDAMVKSLDTSGDGRISFDEFCRLFD
jgi:calmodulin